MIPTSNAEIAALFVGGEHTVDVQTVDFSDEDRVHVLRIGTYVGIIGGSPDQDDVVRAELHNHDSETSAVECHAWKVRQIQAHTAMVNGSMSPLEAYLSLSLSPGAGGDGFMIV